MSEIATLESVAISNFLKSMTAEQEQKAFGVGGIFTKEQVEVFRGIAEKRLPASRLDDFLPNGSLAINNSQMTKVQVTFNMIQLFPLMALIQGRLAKKN